MAGPAWPGRGPEEPLRLPVPAGTEVAALFYSLLETAKLAGVNPKTYLLDATHAALATPGTALLPRLPAT